MLRMIIHNTISRQNMNSSTKPTRAVYEIIITPPEDSKQLIMKGALSPPMTQHKLIQIIGRITVGHSRVGDGSSHEHKFGSGERNSNTLGQVKIDENFSSLLSNLSKISRKHSRDMSLNSSTSKSAQQTLQ